jgi:2-keto-4-pentenoate hydratase/2-oxohepta-3-ene-1,7-dioic acid hydratase in catechol pathway
MTDGLHLARIAADGPDGPQPRIVATTGAEPGRWVDVRAAERLRLERAGATPAAARRLAAALVPGSLAAALEAGDAFLDAARAAAASADAGALAPAGARMLAPIDPPAYRDFMAFDEHFVNGARLRGLDVPPVYYEFPVSYFGNAHAVLGPEDEIPWPHYSERMDFELELGIVIGRSGRDLRPDEALDHVLGLTVFNDFSARDIQMVEMTGGLGPSKGKHFASAVGPRIVSLDALADDLAMTARVNGETWAQGSSATIMWSIAELVAWASAGEPLVAGTLLGSGTVGRGCGMELGRFLSPGDVVELEIAGIGALRNRLGTPPADGWRPEPRTPASETAGAAGD